MLHRCLVALGLLATVVSCCAQETVCGPQRVPTLRQGMPGAATIEIYGTVSTLHGTQMTITTRDGKQVEVDLKKLEGSVRTTAANVGLPVSVLGTRGARGVLVAQVINRAKAGTATWQPDCSSAGPAAKAAP
jgi:hypothetical protein